MKTLAERAAEIVATLPPLTDEQATSAAHILVMAERARSAAA